MAPLEGPLWRAMFSIRCLGRSPAASNFTAMPSLWHASPGDCGPPRRFHVAFEDWITGSEWQLGGAFSHIHFTQIFSLSENFEVPQNHVHNGWAWCLDSHKIPFLDLAPHLWPCLIEFLYTRPACGRQKKALVDAEPYGVPVNLGSPGGLEARKPQNRLVFSRSP